MRKSHVAIAGLIAMLMCGIASADVLWDQTDYDVSVPGFFNVEAGSPPFGLTQYTVGDVVVEGGGWVVTDISAWFGAADPSWGDSISEGRLHIFSKSDVLPVAGVDDPAVSPLVSMSATFEGDHFIVTASGLAIVLEPGEYWVGITPFADAGILGPEPHLATMTILGDATASYDPFAFPGPPGWFNFNPGVDAAFSVGGVEIPGCDSDDEDEDEDDEGVAMCHVPQGNPENAHTIVVGQSAVPAHMNHGDSMGSCEGDGSNAIEDLSGQPGGGLMDVFASPDGMGTEMVDPTGNRTRRPRSGR